MKAAVRGKEAPALNVCIKNNPEKSPINNGAIIQGLRRVRESQAENRHMERSNKDQADVTEAHCKGPMQRRAGSSER